MSGGKSSGGSKDYYGHATGRICQGQLDFIWGMMINNVLVWPKATLWDSAIYKKGRTVIYTDGNVYQASLKSEIDPPAFPWVLFAVPWTAGIYNPGDRRLYNGNVWQAVAQTSSAPSGVIPAPTLGVQDATSINGWIYISTPQAWASGPGFNFWDANSIVAWRGRLYTTPTGTKVEPPNAPWVLWKMDRAASPNPLKFTVEDYGDAFLYWGTDTQNLDTVNEGILSAFGHPAYRYRATLVLKNFLFGTMQATPQDVIILGGRTPIQSLITGNAALMDADWNVNPWCVVAEFLTHPVLGLGLPLSVFNQAAWQAEADRCAANSQLFYISPMYNSLQKVRQLIGDLLGYPDAFIFWTTVATLTAGHWPHGEAVPAFTAANTINRDTIVSEIATNSEGWDGTNSSVVVSFNDIQAAFKSRPVSASNFFNMSATGRLNTLKVDRPHITRFDQAAAWATEMVKINGDLSSNGTLTVRAEKAATIEPGSLFLLTDDELQTSEVQRCIKRVVSAPPTGTVKLSHETERGISPQPYSPTAPPPSVPAGPVPSPLLNALFLQIPSALGTGPNQLICLASRDNEITSGFEVWFQQADATAYQQLATVSSFAIAGIATDHGGHPDSDFQDSDYRFTYNPATPQVQLLSSGVPASDMWNVTVQYQPPSGGAMLNGVEGTDWIVDTATGILTFPAGTTIPSGSFIEVKFATQLYVTISASTPDSDYELIASPRTQDEINDNNLLLIAVQAANPALFEIMSVKAVRNYGGNISYVTVRRAQYNTVKGGDGVHAWGGNDLIFIVTKSSLVPLSHEAFAGLQKVNATARFVLAPSSAWVQADVTDLYDPANNPDGLATQYGFTFNNIYAPTVSVVSMQRNGSDIANINATFAVSDDFEFSFLLNDPNGDLTHATLTAVLGSRETTLYSQNFPPSGSQLFYVKWTFPEVGLWKLAVNVLDAAGNQSSYPVPSDGTGIRIGSGTGATPIIFSYTKSGDWITNLLFGWMPTGATVRYQLQNRGVAYNSSAWTVLPASGSSTPQGQKYGPVPIFKKETKTLYAYSQESGKNDSVVVQWTL